jgi:hypothetical protein
MKMNGQHIYSRGDNIIIKQTIPHGKKQLVFGCGQILEALAITHLLQHRQEKEKTKEVTYASKIEWLNGVTLVQLARMEQVNAQISNPFINMQNACKTINNIDTLKTWALQQKGSESHKAVCKVSTILRGVLLDVFFHEKTGTRLEKYIQRNILAELGLESKVISLGLDESETKNEYAEEEFFPLACIRYMPSYLVMATQSKFHAVARCAIVSPKNKSTVRALFNIGNATRLNNIFTQTYLSPADYANGSTENLKLTSVNYYMTIDALHKVAKHMMDTVTSLLDKKSPSVERRTEETTYEEIDFIKAGLSSGYLYEGFIGAWGAGGSVAMFNSSTQEVFVYIPSSLSNEVFPQRAIDCFIEIKKAMH